MANRPVFLNKEPTPHSSPLRYCPNIPPPPPPCQCNDERCKRYEENRYFRQRCQQNMYGHSNHARMPHPVYEKMHSTNCYPHIGHENHHHPTDNVESANSNINFSYIEGSNSNVTNLSSHATNSYQYNHHYIAGRNHAIVRDHRNPPNHCYRGENNMNNHDNSSPPPNHYHFNRPTVYTIGQTNKTVIPPPSVEDTECYRTPQITPISIVSANRSFDSSIGSTSNDGTPRSIESIRSDIENDVKNMKAANLHFFSSMSSSEDIKIQFAPPQYEQKATVIPKPASPGKKKAGKKSKMYSNYIGVTFNKTHGKYQACITHYRKQHYLGRYKLSTDAALAYDKGAKLLKGQGWKINFSSEEEYWSDRCKEEKGKLHNTGNNILAHVTMSPSSQCSTTNTNRVVHSMTNYGKIRSSKINTNIVTTLSENDVAARYSHYQVNRSDSSVVIEDNCSSTELSYRNKEGSMSPTRNTLPNLCAFQDTGRDQVNSEISNQDVRNNSAPIAAEPPKRNYSSINTCDKEYQHENNPGRFLKSDFSESTTKLYTNKDGTINYSTSAISRKKKKTEAHNSSIRIKKMEEETSPSIMFDNMVEAASVLMALNRK